MKLAIVGLPRAGKTTVFDALTGEQRPTGDWSGGGRFELHEAAVDVPDPRLEALRERFSPPKTTHAQVIYADAGGIDVGSSGAELPGRLVNQLAQMDGLLHVVRVFEDPEVPHPASSVDPARDIFALESEWILHDMLIVERQLLHLRGERGKRGGVEREVMNRQLTLLEEMMGALESERPLRELKLTTEQLESLRGFVFLSAKPALVIANLGEGQGSGDFEGLTERMAVVPLYGALEMEIAQLPAEERGEFMREFGIGESARERVVRASHDMLHLKTFFTLNENELRAWTVKQDATAIEVADTIHSDLARGFIRAEMVTWDSLLDLGSFAEARAGGQLRSGGKEYPVEDGDVVLIRFNL
jgi:GTP-binding protein YchF